MTFEVWTPRTFREPEVLTCIFMSSLAYLSMSLVFLLFAVSRLLTDVLVLLSYIKSLTTRPTP